MDLITKTNEETPISTFRAPETLTKVKIPEKLPKVQDHVAMDPKPQTLTWVQDVFDAFDAFGKNGMVSNLFETVQFTGNRGDFEITQETGEPVEVIPYVPGIESSATFAIEEAGDLVTSKDYRLPVTVEDIKSHQTQISAKINLDMLNEVRRDFYEMQGTLIGALGPINPDRNDINQKMGQFQDALEKQRKELVIHALGAIIEESSLSEDDFAKLAPDERDAYTNAMKGLECAKILVTKAGFSMNIGENETAVLDHVAVAKKLWPILSSNSRFATLTSQVFNLAQ